MSRRRIGPGGPARNPAARAAALLLAALAAAALPAAAEEIVEGPACIADGRTLFVGGAVERGGCRGGTKLRLFGADAPDLDQRCTTAAGTSYACGVSALNALEDLTRRRVLRCELLGDADAAGARPATCMAAEDDLNRAMVERGWAVADRREADHYVPEQEAAKAGKRGLWAGGFDIPWLWRQNLGGRPGR